MTGSTTGRGSIRGSRSRHSSMASVRSTGSKSTGIHHIHNNHKLKKPQKILHLILEGTELSPVGGWFDHTNPYYEIQVPFLNRSKQAANIEWRTVFTSSVMEKEVENPRWPLAKLELNELCGPRGDDLQKPVRVCVWHKPTVLPTETTVVPTETKDGDGDAQATEQKELPDMEDENQTLLIKEEKDDKKEKEREDWQFMGQMETNVQSLVKCSGDASMTAPLWQKDGTEFGSLIMRHARIQMPRAPDGLLSTSKLAVRQSLLVAKRMDHGISRASIASGSRRRKSSMTYTTNKSAGISTITSRGSWLQSAAEALGGGPLAPEETTTAKIEGGNDHPKENGDRGGGGDGDGDADYSVAIHSVASKGSRSQIASVFQENPLVKELLSKDESAVLELTLEGSNMKDMGGYVGQQLADVRSSFMAVGSWFTGGPVGGFLGSTNPYFQISVPGTTTTATTGTGTTTNNDNDNIANDDGGVLDLDKVTCWQHVYRSEAIEDSLNPIWKAAIIPLYFVELDKPFRYVW